MSAITRLVLLVAAIFAHTPVGAAAPKYDNLYVFGDSLSDTGNDLTLTKTQKISPAIPPSESPNRTYYKGRFSNGMVSAEYFWQLLQKDTKASLTPFLSKSGLALKGAINFAFGGSASGYINQTPGKLKLYVPGVLAQIDMFRAALLKQQPPARSLYLIWTGANDYLAGLSTEPAEVVGNIAKGVETLYALGARDFMILNLPDLGQVPAVQNIPGTSPDDFSMLTIGHNDLLKQASDDLASRLGGARIILVDIYALTQTLVGGGTFVASPPALISIAPVSGAADCLFRDPSTCPDINLNLPTDPLYFWDIMHPTTSVHAKYGQAMFDSLPKK